MQTTIITPQVRGSLQRMLHVLEDPIGIAQTGKIRVNDYLAFVESAVNGLDLDEWLHSKEKERSLPIAFRRNGEALYLPDAIRERLACLRPHFVRIEQALRSSREQHLRSRLADWFLETQIHVQQLVEAYGKTETVPLEQLFIECHELIGRLDTRNTWQILNGKSYEYEHYIAIVVEELEKARVVPATDFELESLRNLLDGK